MLGLGRITIPGGVPGSGRVLGGSRGSCSGEPSWAQAVRLSSTSGLPAGSLNTGNPPSTQGGASTDGVFTVPPVDSLRSCSRSWCWRTNRFTTILYISIINFAIKISAHTRRACHCGFVSHICFINVSTGHLGAKMLRKWFVHLCQKGVRKVTVFVAIFHCLFFLIGLWNFTSIVVNCAFFLFLLSVYFWLMFRSNLLLSVFFSQRFKHLKGLLIRHTVQMIFHKLCILSGVITWWYIIPG